MCSTLGSHHPIKVETMTSSTLVETVSIDYEDFTEGFLTCGTCMCTYDSSEHSPKLLSCSHTFCKGCLEAMTSQPGITDSFRCPICRESVPLPRGGVSQLPASFVVNQLLDLVSRQRREVVPKCSVHLNQQLLFCEPCDCVFCALCSKESHQSKLNQQHTVIPFSIAIKRMSEILLYKAHECVDKLREAQYGIVSEMNELDSNCERTCEQIEQSFERLQKMLNQRKKQLLDFTKRTVEDKRQVLQKQETLLNEQRSEVEAQCSGLPQYQLDVRNLSRKISELNARLESLSKAQELQENCFIQFEPLDEQAVEQLQAVLKQLGQVRTSRTCPAKCQLTVAKCAAHLRAIATLTTFDYAGQAQKIGGEPVDAQLKHVKTDRCVPTRTVDLRCGKYEIHFVPDQPGDYELAVRIFDRPVQQFPLRFEASAHINPICIYGGSGGDAHQFRRPVALSIDQQDGRLYILDTGNSRVKMLTHNSSTTDAPFIPCGHLSGISVLSDTACTGLALQCNSDEPTTLFLSNWRSRTIAQMDAKTGKLIANITAPQLIEPTSLAVTSTNELVVVDNGASSVFIFDTDGRMRLRISANLSDTERPQFTAVGAVTVDHDNNVIIADRRISVFCGRTGKLMRRFESDSKGPIGSYGGLTLDGKGNLLATRMEKTRNCVQIFDYESGQLKYSIDSSDARLKRPSGLATTDDFHVIVVDLGNDCIKKYRYF